MQNESKVIRLQLQAIHAHIGYLMEELSPDEVVPHMVHRRLFSQKQAAVAWEMSSQQEKLSAVIEAIIEEEINVLGMFPTLCATLVSAGQGHIAERLLNSE